MKLLFICTHNRCRSILAEAITNHLAKGQILGVSGGSEPAGVVHPLSLKYLADHGIETHGLKSQSWDDFTQFAPDAIITLCDSAAAETCPSWFGQSVQAHWGLNDPSKLSADENQTRAAFNTTIDILQRRIKTLLEHDLYELSRDRLNTALNKIAASVN